MSWRRITVGLVAVVVLGLAWIGYGLYSTWRGIPEAYAAWDTGTLLIEYLETHGGAWPRSWDQLLSAKETLEEHGKQLRGIDGRGGFIYGDLRARVSVNWNIDVQAITAFDGREADLRIVTRADGRPFQVVWEGADPNGMVLRYLKQNRAD